MIWIELILPFPPTINDYYGKNGHVSYVKPKGKKFRKECRESIMEQLPWGSWKPLEERLKVTIYLHMPDRRRRDLDNYKKALFDACSKDEKDDFKGLWVDDSQIDQDSTYRGEIFKGGLVRMVITDAGSIVCLPDYAKAK